MLITQTCDTQHFRFAFRPIVSYIVSMLLKATQPLLHAPTEPEYLAGMDRLPSRPGKSRVNFEVTHKVMESIRARAVAQRLTITAYIIRLLEADGVDMTDQIDRRAFRASQRPRKSA